MLFLLAALLAACAAPGEVALNPTRTGGPPPRPSQRVALTSDATATPISLAECLWTADVFAWVDSNGNGRRDGDPQEAWLPNVLFHIAELRDEAFEYNGNALSNSRGKALAVLSAECGPTEVEITAQYPSQYQPTTPERVQLQVTRMPIVVRFGFQLKSGVAPPETQAAASLRCSSYPLTGDDVVADLALAPDGTVWAAAYAAVFRLDPPDYVPRVYGPPDGLPDTIMRTLEVVPDGTVWVGTNEGAARFDGKRWETFAVFGAGRGRGLVDDIAIGGDDSVWFVGAGHMSAYDPRSDAWDRDPLGAQGSGSSDIFDSIMRAPEGSLWFFGLETLGQLRGLRDNKPEWKIYRYGEAGFVEGFFSRQGVAGQAGPVWLAGMIRDAPAPYTPALISLDPSTMAHVLYTYDTTDGAMVSDQIRDLALASDGSVWLSYQDHSLVHFTPTGTAPTAGQWERYGLHNGLSFNAIRDVEVGPDGALWIAYEREDPNNSMLRLQSLFVDRCVVEP